MQDEYTHVYVNAPIIIIHESVENKADRSHALFLVSTAGPNSFSCKSTSRMSPDKNGVKKTSVDLDHVDKLEIEEGMGNHKL